MTNSNENELKVGEVISHKYKDKWYLWNVEKSPRSPAPNIFFIRSGRNTNFIHYDEEGDTWQRGIHPSLIPDGFCLSKIEDSETQTDLSIENTSLRKELEAARKELSDIGDFMTHLINEPDISRIAILNALPNPRKAAPKPKEG